MPNSVLAIISLKIFFLLSLTGCVTAPSRSDPDAFFVVKTSQIPSGNVQSFVDCVSDGFDKAHFILTNSTTRQQRRSDSYRIETLAGGTTITVSADVFLTGVVVLNESKSASLINTSGQKAAFDSCLIKYSFTK